MTSFWPESFHKRRVRGFTLVELIVAMGITTIILTLLVSITGVALDGWRVSRNKVRAARQAKAALDQLSKDFESLVIRTGNNYEWMFADVDEVDAGSVDEGDAAKLVFFTAATDRYNGQIGVSGVDDGGDISAVGYRLIYKDPVENDQGDFSVFGLYRNLVDPKETFEELLAQDELLASGGGSGAFSSFMRDNEAGDISNFVCENIYELTIGFLVEYTELQGSSLVTKHERLTIIDTTGDGAIDELRVKGNGIFADPEPSNADEIQTGRIVTVDVAITVLTDHAMGVLRNNTGLSGSKLDEFISKNSFRYSKTIRVPQS